MQLPGIDVYAAARIAYCNETSEREPDNVLALQAAVRAVWREAQRADPAALRAQRDALLEACKAALGLRAAAGRDFGPAVVECDRIEEQLRSAIALCGGGK